MKPYWSDNSGVLYQGDTLEVLKTLPSEGISCVITSPPYYGLRSYLPSNHEDKPKEIGLEKTYQEFLEKLWAIFDEVKRVLRKDGTCWVNFGDTYNASGGCGWTGLESKNWKQKAQPHNDKTLQAKCLMMIPEHFAIGMIDRGWILRNKIVWFKPNGLPSSVKDRFSKGKVKEGSYGHL